VVLNTITLTLTSSFQFLVNTSESVTVEPSVRLVGGKSDASGRLEIQLNPESAYSPVCVHYWDEDDTKVVCKELGYRSEVTVNKYD
jgi:hypothetical protein